nr:XTP/dITP diphosphatase [uncultured Anaeromusa sp.]
MIELVVASKNQGKIAEFEKAFSRLSVKILSLKDFGDIPEAVEDGATFAENARKKAQHYLQYTKKPCLADDSGLEVDALGGAPGVFSARYAGEGANDTANNAKLLQRLSNVESERRTGRFCCALALAFPDGRMLEADGAVEGRLLMAEKGDGGFGYDPLFFLPELAKTFAELTLAEKNAISHRGKAMVALAVQLAEAELK